MITIYSKIPYELKELNNWGVFRLVPRKGKKDDKIPIDAKTGLPGKSNDETTWSDFETAVEASKKFDGLIFYFKAPYIGIDLDNIKQEIINYKNGYTENNIVSEFADTLNSYTEVSHSGTGIHIILKGNLPESGRKKGDVEMYQSGRFFVTTGDAIGGFNHIADDTDLNKIGRLHEKYIGIREVAIEDVGSEDRGNHLSEKDVIKRASESQNGERFKSLMHGGWEDIYLSQSEADLAFCNMLAFWTNKDIKKMDTIVRMSSLNRDKWDRRQNSSTYGKETLEKAISGTMRTYDPDPEMIFTIADGSDGSIKEVESKAYSYDDTGNGERFSDNFESIVRYNHNRKKWVFYNQKHWELDDQEKHRLLVNEMLERMKQEPVLVFGDIDEEAAEKNKSKHLKYSRGSNGKTNMLKEAQPLLRVTSDDFDQDINLLNVQNGYIDLTTGKLHDHDKDKFFLKIADVEYSDNVDAPLWDNFLHTIFDGDKELIDYIQRAVGYSLSGEVIEEKMFILHGNGRNGKSVFLNVITKMLGDYTMNIQPDTLMVKQASGGGPSGHIARLADTRFVTSSEPNQGNRFDEGQIKSLTGTGDKITARFMHGEDFEFYPQFKMWLATNYKPKISGTDDGIWRRLSVIPFTVQIPIDKVDKRLSDKLFNEMTGILKWAVEGYQEWQRIGLAEPETVKQQVAEYRKEMDPIEFFISERCVRDGEAFETSERLFNAYDMWANESNEYRMKKHEFYKEIGTKFKAGRNKENTRRGRIGLRILDNPYEFSEDGNNVISLDFDNTFN